MQIQSAHVEGQDSHPARQGADEVRREVIGIIEDLKTKSSELELPALSEPLEGARTKLLENKYKMLVVGEAKRGKSTFVNALIGRKILPEDVGVATSQVFSVTPSEQEAYRIRFEDDSSEELSLSDLPRYGSQVVADAGGAPDLKKTIRWIEVDVPIRFCPPNVSILDTPGLGALYAAHAQITHRFLPHADAVIFVLDSERELVRTEISFIETLLNTTKHIFFIQTKIDLFDKEKWQEIQQRNLAILQQHFSKQLQNMCIWPIASKTLIDAAEATNEADRAIYLTVSRHRDLIAALQAFLQRVSGWSRSFEALVLAEGHYAAARRTLAGRLAILNEESKVKQVEFQKTAVQNTQMFQTEWGQSGSKRLELERGIRRTIDLAKQSFRQSLQPRDEIAIELENEIDALASTEQATDFANAMGEKATAVVMVKWRSVCDAAGKQCASMLIPFVDAAEAVVAPSDPAQTGIRLSELQFAPPQGYYERFKGGIREMGPAGVVAGIVYSTMGLTSLAVAGWMFLGAAAYGYVTESGRQVTTAKDMLKRNLQLTLQDLRNHFFNVDQTSGRFSPVDEYFAELERGMFNGVRVVSARKLDEAKAETQRLAASLRLEGEKKREAGESVQRQLTALDETGKMIRRVAAQLSQLEKAASIQPLSSKV